VAFAELPARVRLAAHRRPSLFALLVLAAPALLGIARLLPAEGPGLALRLFAAACIVLLVPGALILRALGWPASVGVAIAGAFVWSLVVVFAALALTFAVDASLSLTVLVFGLVALAAALPAARVPLAAVERSDLVAVAGLVGAGVLFAMAVWWVAQTVQGDGLFHLARVRKLDELPELSSVRVVGEFPNGALHPGYAFPLWHGALALVARLAAVDPTQVVLYLAAVMVPLALVIAYAAGKALFGSWAGGVAVAAAQTALVAFARSGTGAFIYLSLPATVSSRLLAPALYALFFAYLRTGRRTLLLSVAAASLGLAVIHPTYALFAVVPLVGFLAVRALFAREDRADWLRAAAGIGAAALAAVLFALWLLPVLRETLLLQPSEAVRQRELRQYADSLNFWDGSFFLAPDAISRGGAPVVVGLLAIPLAVFAARRRWSALVLGGSLAVLAVMLLPPVFTAFADHVSLVQARRVKLFLPLEFAVAGAALLLGRLRIGGAALALAVGIALELVYPCECARPRLESGPTWPVWVAVFGGLAAVAAGILWRRRGPEAGLWTATAALLLVAPTAVVGLANLEREKPDRNALTPGLVAALRTEARPLDVVFSDLAVSYRVPAYAPLTVAASPPAHVIDTSETRPYERREDVIRFYARSGTPDGERRAILAKYGTDWLVVDKKRSFPEEFVRSLKKTYEDSRYALYRAVE
jgi:hypothetical protein